MRDPQLWFEFVAAVLLDALAKHDPDLRGRFRAARAEETGKEGSSNAPHLS